MKKVLVLGYSQTGQLHDLLSNITEDLSNSEIDFVKIEPVDPYPFPWDSFTFFSQMPKAVQGHTVKLNDFNFKYEKYDLIVFGYQVWYLSPSVPTQSILAHPKFQKIARDTDVITVIGARNMWLMSQERVKESLQNMGANLIANIALVDRTTNMISVLTITYWLMTGKRDNRWGILPKPGIQDKDMEQAREFSKPISQYLEGKNINLQESLLSLGATKVKIVLMFTESRAILIFRKWAQIINKRGTTPKKLKNCLTLFRIYLNIAIFFISPIVLTIFSIARLFIFGRLKKQKSYYQGITLK